MPVSQSRKFHAKRDGTDQPSAPGAKPYAIIHPEFRPDMRGEFTGGHAIRMMPDGTSVVDLTDAQAMFHLDQGSIAPYSAAGASPASSGASGASEASPAPAATPKAKA